MSRSRPKTMRRGEKLSFRHEFQRAKHRAMEKFFLISQKVGHFATTKFQQKIATVALSDTAMLPHNPQTAKLCEIAMCLIRHRTA